MLYNKVMYYIIIIVAYFHLQISWLLEQLGSFPHWSDGGFHGELLLQPHLMITTSVQTQMTRVKLNLHNE